MIRVTSTKRIIKSLKETLDLNIANFEELKSIPINKDGSDFKWPDIFDGDVPIEPHYIKIELLFKCPFIGR